MNLKNFETHVNRVILQRSQDYLRAVDALEETEPGFWQAYVEGSSNYEVEVQLNGDEVTYWSCSCPYDQGPLCKHVAATLHAIRQQASLPASKKRKPTKREQLEQVLSALSAEELAGYVRELLQADRQRLDTFLLRFQRFLPNTVSPVERYQQLFEQIVRKYSDHGYIDYNAADNFGEEVSELLDTLEQSGMALADHADIAFSIAQGLAGVANSMDDSNGELGALMYGIKSELEFVYARASADLQGTLFTLALAARFDAGLADFGLDEVFAELAQAWALENTARQDSYLLALDKALNANVSTWQHSSFLNEKLQLLQDWNRQEEVEAVAAAHMAIPSIREKFVRKAIDDKDFDKARRLIAEGIALAEQAKEPYNVQRWQTLLLEIAYLLDDKPAIRAALEQEYQRHCTLSAYLKLKAHYSAEEWPAVSTRLYAMIPPDEGYHRHNKTVQAAILAEENDLPALYELVKAQPEREKSMAPLYREPPLFKQYAPLLAPLYPDDVPVAYAGLICDHLHNSTGRNIYQQTIDDLLILRKMPEGEAMVKNLVRGFCERYKTRKLMVEMFSKAFGK